MSGHQALGSCVLWNERLNAEQGARPEHEPLSACWYQTCRSQLHLAALSHLLPEKFPCSLCFANVWEGRDGRVEAGVLHVLGNNCDARSAEKTWSVVPKRCTGVKKRSLPKGWLWLVLPCLFLSRCGVVGFEGGS